MVVHHQMCALRDIGVAYYGDLSPPDEDPLQ